MGTTTTTKRNGNNYKKNQLRPASREDPDGCFQSAQGLPTFPLMGCQAVVQSFQVSMGNRWPLPPVHRLLSHDLLQCTHTTFQLCQTGYVLPSPHLIKECTPPCKHQHHPHSPP